MARVPFHPENPVRQGELEKILTLLARKLLQEVDALSGNSEDIARQIIDEVYRR